MKKILFLLLLCVFTITRYGLLHAANQSTNRNTHSVLLDTASNIPSSQNNDNLLSQLTQSVHNLKTNAYGIDQYGIYTFNEIVTHNYTQLNNFLKAPLWTAFEQTLSATKNYNAQDAQQFINDINEYFKKINIEDRDITQQSARGNTVPFYIMVEANKENTRDLALRYLTESFSAAYGAQQKRALRNASLFLGLFTTLAFISKPSQEANISFILSSPLFSLYTLGAFISLFQCARDIKNIYRSRGIESIFDFLNVDVEHSTEDYKNRLKHMDGKDVAQTVEQLCALKYSIHLTLYKNFKETFEKNRMNK